MNDEDFIKKTIVKIAINQSNPIDKIIKEAIEYGRENPETCEIKRQFGQDTCSSCNRILKSNDNFCSLCGRKIIYE